MEDIPSQSLFSILLSLESVIGLSILLLLLFFSGMISGSEVAFFSLSSKDKDDLKKSKEKSSQRVMRLLKSDKQLLATILIINNFVNIGIIILSNYLLETVYNIQFESILKGLAIKVIGIGGTILFFGEILPKIYASKYSISFSKLCSGSIIMLQKILSKPANLLIQISKTTEKRVSKNERRTTPSINELSEAVKLTSKELNEKEYNLLLSLAHFGKKTVNHVMTPRVDIFSIDHATPFHELKTIISDCSFSRIPIYEKSIDKIIGILYLKDLLPHLNKGKNFDWKSLIRSVFYVSEYQKLNDLFREFQKRKVHFAVVIDEYGGTEGIVTLENVIEEIIGNIIDEFDHEEQNYKQINETTFVFDAKTPIPEMYRIMKINQDNMIGEIEGKDVTTLAGAIIELAGKIPQKNERIPIKNLSFKILSADRRKIKKVEVTTLENEHN